MQTLKDGLGVRRLVLQIHDASFPLRLDDEVGRGSPYSTETTELNLDRNLESGNQLIPDFQPRSGGSI